jgi:hypothetical protein
VPRQLTLAASVSALASLAGAVGTPHGPERSPIRARWSAAWRLGGRRAGTSRVPWQVATLHRRLRRPRPLAIPGEVTVVVAMQAMSGQPASCDTVRVEETIKASVVNLYGDLPCLRELLMAMLN